MDHFIPLLKYLSNHMHFITNGYKCFSKTNSTDPRRRVPLILLGMKVLTMRQGMRSPVCACVWKYKQSNFWSSRSFKLQDRLFGQILTPVLF